MLKVVMMLVSLDLEREACVSTLKYENELQYKSFKYGVLLLISLNTLIKSLMILN